MRRSTMVLVFLAISSALFAQQREPARKGGGGGATTFQPVRLGGSEETLTRFIRMRNRIRDLDLRMHRENGGNVLEGFTGRLGGGQIAVTGKIDWSRPGNRHKATLTLQSVGTREFLDAFDIVLDGRIATTISGRADLQWNGTKMKAMKQSLEATADLNIGPGYVANARVLEYVAHVSGIEGLQRMEFSRGIMRGRASQQTLYIDELLLEGPTLRARLTGTMNLLTDEIRLRPELAISQQLAQTSSRSEVRAGMQILDYLTNENKSQLVSVPLPIVFGGTLKKPILMMDTEGKSR